MEPTSNSTDIAGEFVKRVSAHLTVTAAYLFGSRARGTAREGSDFDIILVSPDFRGQLDFKRPSPLYRHWDYSISGLDLLCYTPEEFDRSRSMLTILADVLPTAVKLAG